ncbi:hypothetical protein HDU85_005032, partial [Gaertneriomyces sp. JEL0708]
MGRSSNKSALCWICGIPLRLPSISRGREYDEVIGDRYWCSHCTVFAQDGLYPPGTTDGRNKIEFHPFVQSIFPLDKLLGYSLTQHLPEYQWISNGGGVSRLEKLTLFGGMSPLEDVARCRDEERVLPKGGPLVIRKYLGGAVWDDGMKQKAEGDGWICVVRNTPEYEVDFEEMEFHVEESTVAMNSFKGSFSFRNDNLRSTDLPGGFDLRIERAGPAIARLYVVDAAAAEVPLPAGLTVFDNTNNVNVNPIIGTQFFILAWTDNYVVRLNGTDILALDNQRQWALRSTPD